MTWTLKIWGICGEYISIKNKSFNLEMEAQRLFGEIFKQYEVYVSAKYYDGEINDNYEEKSKMERYDVGLVIHISVRNYNHFAPILAECDSIIKLCKIRKDERINFQIKYEEHVVIKNNGTKEPWVVNIG
jgi:hypothetical protein